MKGLKWRGRSPAESRVEGRPRGFNGLDDTIGVNEFTCPAGGGCSREFSRMRCHAMFQTDNTTFRAGGVHCTHLSAHPDLLFQDFRGAGCGMISPELGCGVSVVHDPALVSGEEAGEHEQLGPDDGEGCHGVKRVSSGSPAGSAKTGILSSMQAMRAKGILVRRRNAR